MTPEAVLRILLVFGALLALWNKQRRAAARAAEARPAPVAHEDAMEAERTRRVQEEIRRKIAQRTAVAPPRRPAPPPVVAAPAPAFAAAPPLQAASPLSAAEASPFRADTQPAAHPQGRDWQGELRQRTEARRAIVLREILGPPVGLR